MKQLHIVITGANSGIGLTTTKKYLHLGHHVYALSRSINELNTLYEKFPKTLHIVEGDVSCIKTVESFYQSISNKIDILVVNAGIAIAQPLIEVTEESFDNTFNINVKGAFFTVQKSLPLLNNKASVVLIGSIQANKGAGVWATYGATKAAIRSLTRSFAEELSSKGIRVNCLSPGVTKTPIFEKFGLEKNVLNNIIEQVESSTPLGRLGEPEEIANAIYFLCSDQASFITGVDLQVDGGLIQL